jgi:hypothetical protein
VSKSANYECSREREGKGIENLFSEILAENFANIRKDMDVQVQEAQRTCNRSDKKVLPQTF